MIVNQGMNSCDTLQVSELRKNLHFQQQVSRCESFVVPWQGSENARSEVRAQKAIADAAGLGTAERHSERTHDLKLFEVQNALRCLFQTSVLMELKYVL